MNARGGEVERAWAARLDGLTVEALAALAGRTRVRQLAAGRVLYEQGESSLRSALYVVLTGLVTVEQVSVAGARRVLAVLAAGDLAGEVGVLDPGLRSTSTRAVVASTVGVVDRVELLAWLGEFPAAGGPLTRAVSRRVRYAEDALVDHGFLGMAERVVRVLLDLADRWGSPGPDGSVVIGPLTQVQLAGLVGSSREATNRALKRLAALGLLQAGRRHVVLLDLPGLHHILRAPRLGDPALSR